MKEEIKQKWVSALRSGKYKPGRTYLSQIIFDGQTEYCCLGVLCDLAEKEGVVRPVFSSSTGIAYATYYATGNDADRNTYALPVAVMDWARLSSSNPEVRASGHTEIGVVSCLVSLAKLNDDGKSFEEIARLIEEQL